MKRNKVLIISCIVIAIIILSFLGLMLLTEILAREYPEEVYKEIASPDNATKLIITHYKQYFPYGVKGNIYIENDEGKKKIRSFFVDFIEDIDNQYEGTKITWSGEEKIFYYGEEKLNTNY